MAFSSTTTLILILGWQVILNIIWSTLFVPLAFLCLYLNV